MRRRSVGDRGDRSGGLRRPGRFRGRGGGQRIGGGTCRRCRQVRLLPAIDALRTQACLAVPVVNHWQLLFPTYLMRP
ncbi:hypothetical protein SCOCK_670006 [Actinacidiphila cocklensis]|uniref:Uncharacterized protein n=1 Tax=Actinacidiphila cocklensis TaxID=887465 RepID=A0A9W4E2G7_9ACTN|nr:hypothetical protein SCOCK_670006 [Actinacidiphila cocklensis]